MQELFNATRGCALKSHVTPPKPRWLKGFHTKITISLRPLFKECAIADTSPSLPTLKSSDFIQFMFNLLSLNSVFFCLFYVSNCVFYFLGGGSSTHHHCCHHLGPSYLTLPHRQCPPLVLVP